MKKKYSLILSFLITGLIASNYYLFSSLEENVLETVIVARVIDGDTLDLEDGRRVRLININSPEKNQFGYEDSTSFLKNYENLSVGLEVVGTGRYGRDLGRIYTPNYLNLEIVEKGFASKFLVEDSEKKIFYKAEERAVTNQKGIWKNSQYISCFNMNINKEEELVIIKSECGQINMNSWVLKDESTRTYEFPPISLGQIALHSGKGQDNFTDLHWGYEKVWNNDRDTLYLFDNNGGLAHHESYGY